MKEQYAFFASVFSRELERWKKETGKTQGEFASLVNTNQNMITRYKKGECYPTYALDDICKELCVDRSIFFPQTFEDKYRYDPEYRHRIDSAVKKAADDMLEEAGINLDFWNFLWAEIPHAQTLVPTTADKADTTMIPWYLDDGSVVYICQQSVELIHDLQRDVAEYASMQLIKRILYRNMTAFPDQCGNRAAHTDAVITSMVADILRDESEGE